MLKKLARRILEDRVEIRRINETTMGNPTDGSQAANQIYEDNPEGQEAGHTFSAALATQLPDY